MAKFNLDFHGLDLVVKAYTDDNEIEIDTVRSFHGGKEVSEWFTAEAIREMTRMLQDQVFNQQGE
jgi:hypothetical protein